MANNSSLKRWLLVNYPGYPYAPSSLMPDNGLAILAAALLDAGHEVQIFDYATVSVLARFSTPDLTRRLQRAWQTAFPADGVRPSAIAKLRLLWDLRRSESCREQMQRQIIGEISDEIVDHIRANDVQAVGFKLWNGDGILGSAAVAAAIRRACPDVRIFGGGPQVDIFMEHILHAFPVFDALAHGEGEETIVQLAEKGGDDNAYGSIPNLIFTHDGRARTTELKIVEDLDTLPTPVYSTHVYPAMAGGEKIRIPVIDESRGCRNNCAFCIHPTKSNHNLRTRSIPSLMQEVEDTLKALGGTRTFRFAGSCTPYELFNAFAREILAQGRNWRYASFAHIRGGEQAHFEDIRNSGCLALFFGIESGSPSVLKGMRKGLNVAAIPETIAMAKRAGIFTVGSLIYPAPFETDTTRQETLSVIRSCRPDAVTVQPAGVVPRTDWFLNPDRYGIRFRDRDDYLRRALRWKVKLLLPPTMWEPLPVWIDGASWRKTLKKTASFTREIEAEGMLTAASHDTCLMADVAGMEVREFRDRTRCSLMTGDADGIRELVEKLNSQG